MDEPKPAPVKLLDTPTINLQQPNPNALPHTYSHFVGTLKSKMPDSNFPAPGTYPGIVGTSTLSDALKIKKENLDIQEYLKSGDVTKQTPPPKPSRKVIHSSAELQKILSPKHKGSGSKAKQTLFGSPRALASQMDLNEMLHSMSSIKCEQMIKLDNLLKSNLPKNYVDGIFKSLKRLGTVLIPMILVTLTVFHQTAFLEYAQYIYLNWLTTIWIQVDPCLERCYADTYPCIV